MISVYTLTDSPTTAPAWTGPLLKQGESDRKTPQHMSCDQETLVQQQKEGLSVSKGIVNVDVFPTSKLLIT